LVVDGHDTAFEVLFDRHVADALWFAKETLGSWAEAEDAVRHSFAAAHAYLAARGDDVEFAPWLHTILANHCLSMLQARSRTSSAPAGEAAVVDLEEWRQRRKLLGVALPAAAASAPLRDSVMAACGIGTTAAAAGGAPLLAGTVAKVAVVAVLAGTAGVAGDRASNHAPPPERRDVAAVAEPSAAAARPSAVAGHGPARQASGRGQRLAEPKAREPAEPRRRRGGTGNGLTPRAQAQVEQPQPRGSAPPAVGGDPIPITRAPAEPVTTAVPEALSLGQSTLGDVGDLVATAPAVVDGALGAESPTAGALSEIGDDLDVTAGEVPVDVPALSPRGSGAAAKKK
jgi:DNA-directed RNA polymerase specialized sigma24 family protein